MNVEPDLLGFWGVGVSAGWQYDGAAGTCPSRQMHEGCMLGARSSQSASFEAPWAGRDRSLNAPSSSLPIRILMQSTLFFVTVNGAPCFGSLNRQSHGQLVTICP
jgi:hypothetical protein